MGGGLMQLVAYGAQDVYLTGNPQITFFKVVYRRHTNFSVEPIQQVFNGAADFGRTVTCNLNRNGDLITNMYAVVKLNDLSEGDNKWGYVRRLGYALIEETKVEIGGSKIDEQYGDWLNIWHELSHKVGQERGHAKLVGDVAELTNLTEGHPAYTLYVPLAYWFNRHNGLALPLIALQYHDVRVTIQYRRASECVNYAGSASAPAVSMDDSYLLIDYVYLDSEERKRFAQASHEYLIEQLQFTGSESLTTVNNKYRLNFNHPSKYLIWAAHLDKYTASSQYIAWATDGNWEAARELWAKRAWLATRTGLNASTASVVISVDGSSMNEVVQPSIDSVNLGQTALAQIVDEKIDAQLVFVGSTGTNTEASTNNVVILRNDITSEDMSQTVADLLVDATSSTNAENFFNFGDNSVNARDWFNYGRNVDGTSNCVTEAKLQLNGHDRFQARDGNYFNYVQPYQHFSNTPADGINVYSFALKPEEHQPSGSCNFSRIDNATLNVTCAGLDVSTSNSSVVNIYTVNYNVLRVMSGMAGTAYSN